MLLRSAVALIRPPPNATSLGRLWHQPIAQHRAVCSCRIAATSEHGRSSSLDGLWRGERRVHTTAPIAGLFGGPSVDDEPLIKRVAKKFGWSESSKSYLNACGYLMYIKVADEVNYMNFFKSCGLEDTFVSWFMVVELHIWMLGARMMQEGKDGRIVRNAIYKALWEDIHEKAKKLEGALASARKRQIQELGDQFQAALISYDEGLQSSDAVLAGALWRRLLKNTSGNGIKTPEEYKKDVLALEMLVLYVRSQFYNLNELGKSHMLRRKFEWSPFDQSLLKLADRSSEKSAKRVGI